MKTTRKMKGILTFLALILVVSLSRQVKAANTYQDGDYKFTLNKGKATITDYVGTNGTITVPSQVNFNGSSYPVTAIGFHALYENKTLVAVTLPDSIIEAGGGLLTRCSNLEYVDLPNNLSWIEGFSECPKLKTVIMPSCEVTLGWCCFNSCTSLEILDFSNVIAIGNHAFSYSSIKDVYLPKCKSIGDWAFRYCTKLESVILGNKMETIGEYGTFAYCTSLKRLDLGNSVRRIKSGAFYGCTSLVTVTVPASVTECEAFSNCTSLTTLNFYGKHLHGPYKCTNLREINLGDQVEWISGDFAGDDSLKSITIPKNTKVDGNAFREAPVLTTICGYKGSSAQDFANKKGLTFVALQALLQDQTITANKTSYKVTCETKAFNLGAKSSSGGTLTYASGNKKVVKVSPNGTVSIVAPGYAKITIKAPQTDDYKAATATIAIYVYPKKNQIRSVTGTKSALKVTWTKDTKAKGYYLQYATNKKFSNAKTIHIKSNKTITKTIKKLKKGTYYFRVASYTTIGGKNKYVWSKTYKKTVKR